MTPELQRALKRHVQWFGSYKKSCALVKVQVWLIVNSGRIEFLTGKDSYKVRRLRRNPRAIGYVGSENGPAIAGTAQIVSEKAELARVYRRIGKHILCLCCWASDRESGSRCCSVNVW